MPLSAEVRMLCDEVRRFIRDEVEPRSRWIEENDAVPDDLVQMARAMGLFGLTIPEEYGGSGLDLAGKCAIEEEMGKTNYGFATLIGNHTGISTAGIVALGNAQQKQKYLPRMASGEWIGSFALTEAQAGSDPAAMRTTAVKKGDRYVLNGEKIYITNAGLAHVFTVMAITDKAKGIKGISAFLVERDFPGFSVGRNELKMGMHGCTTAPLAFSDCEVPAENLLGAEGMGYVQALKTLTAGRVTVSARCVGMMDKLIAQCVGYMKMRTQGGKKLAEYQGLQWMLADMQTQLTASRLMLYAAARSRGGDGPFPDPMLAAQAKIHASETAIKIVNDALQIFGASGYSRDLPLERMARDVRMFTIGGGTAQVLRTLVASKMLGWKLPQTRDGYAPKPSMRNAAE